MRRLPLIIGLLLVLCASSALAQIDAGVTAYTNNAISIDETAYFGIRVTSEYATEQTFTIVPQDPSWVVDTIPRSDYLFTLKPGKTKLINISVKPKATSDLDIDTNYIVDLGIKTEGTLEEKLVGIPVRLQDSETRRRYLLGRCLHIEPVFTRGALDPRNPIIISTDFSASTCENLDNIIIHIESELFSGKSVPDTEMRFSINRQTDPGIYPVTVHVFKDEYEVRTPTLALQIAAYEDITSQAEVTSNILGLIQKKKLVITNDGNTPVTDQEYSLKKSWYDLFRSYDPKPREIVTDEGNRLAWTLNLGKAESTTIRITTNNIPVTLAVLIIVLVITYLILTRDRIEITKKVAALDTDGELSRFKVMITARNLTNMTQSGIKINDKIPHIASIENSDYIGTVRPSKILKHPKKGTMVIWELDDLNPKEERILYYIIKSKLSIIGHFNLPSAAAKMKDIFKRTVKIHSNRAVVTEKKRRRD